MFQMITKLISLKCVLVFFLILSSVAKADKEKDNPFEGRPYNALPTPPLEPIQVPPLAPGESLLTLLKRYWPQDEVRPAFAKYVASLMGWKHMEDFYGFTISLMKECGFKTDVEPFLRPYINMKPLDFLQDSFPNYHWLPWLFERSPKGFWDKVENRLWFLNYVKEKEGWKVPEDACQLSVEIINAHGGRGLLGKPHGLLTNLWAEWVPHMDCEAHNTHQAHAFDSNATHDTSFPWQPHKVPKSFWLQHENQVAYINYVAKGQGWKTEEECFLGLTYKVLLYYWGARLLMHFTFEHNGYALEAIQRHLCPFVDSSTIEESSSKQKPAIG